jgi:hypothetical protein
MKQILFLLSLRVNDTSMKSLLNNLKLNVIIMIIVFSETVYSVEVLNFQYKYNVSCLKKGSILIPALVATNRI